MFQIKRWCRYVLGFSLFYPAVLFAQTASNDATPAALSTPAPVEASANSADADKTTTLEPIVVTANRREVSVEQATGTVDVITSQDIQEKQARTVFDALQDQPGIHIVQTGAPGEISSLFIRGGTDEQTLVLLDGIPLTDPIGVPPSFDYLDQIQTDDIDRIEVVRGPQSVFYGSNAMSGVVNIITKKGQGVPQGSLGFEGGSYGTFRETASAGGGPASGYFNLSVSRFDTDGFPNLAGGSVNNDDHNSTGSLSLGSVLAPNLEENVFVRYYQSRTHLDAYNSSFVLSDDPDYFANQYELTAGSRTTWTLLDGFWTQALELSFTDDNRLYKGNSNSANTYFEDGNFDGQTAQIVWQNNLRLMKEETVLVGFQGQQQWGNQYDSSGYSDASYLDFAGGSQGSNRQGSLFASSQTNVNERFFLNLGGRWDDNSEFGSHWTGQAGAAYVFPGTETKLKATLGSAFLAPSVYQLYVPVYGNSSLQPETSLGFDFGFEQPFAGKDLVVGSTFFHNDFSNLINFNFVTSQYYNIGTAQSEGVENFVEFKGLRKLDAKINYTYTTATDTQTQKELLRHPWHEGGLDLRYSFGDVEVGASVDYTGERYDTDYLGNIIVMPAYFLVGLKASYQLDKNLQMTARVDNLLDQKYQEVFGYNTPGLSAFGGIKVSM